MEEQRVRARASAGREGGEDAREKLRAFATAAGAPSVFTGYETTEQATAVASVVRRGRPRAGQARRVPVLRDRRRPGPRRRRDRVRGRRLLSAKVVDVVRLGDDQALVLEPLTGELHDGERVVRARRPQRAPRDRVQPHRDAPAARGAARAARHARAPGRLLRRPGQAALRLHPRLAAERRGPRVGRGSRQRR